MDTDRERQSDAPKHGATGVDRSAWFAYIGAFVALTGVQLIAPAFPPMRDALGLTDQQVALVMSVYLLPAAIAAIPVGVLADRIGRRRVFAWSLVIFGVAGLLQPVAADSFGLFLGLRFIQGALFGGLLPLTMTIVGDAYRGNELIAAQGKRSIAMQLGDGLLPIVGGVLAVTVWWLPWLGQGVAILLGVVVWRRMTDPPRRNERRRLWDLEVLRMFGRGSILALEYLGVVRMFLKFALLTALAILLVDDLGLTVAFAGLVLGTSALAATAAAALAGRLARRVRPVAAIVFAMLMMGAALVGYVAVERAGPILVVAVFYGIGDGLLGVFTNSLVTAVPSAKHRASFVGLTGAVRSLGKFLAPVVVAVVLALFSMTALMLLLAAIAFTCAAVALAIRPLEPALAEARAPADDAR